MSGVALDRVLERLREKAERSAEFAEALGHLAADDLDDPFGRPPDSALAVARRINRRRQHERAEQLRGRSLTTPQVVELIGSVSNRKAIDRRRKRNRLLGLGVGNETLHPDWQFDHRQRDTREGLERVLAALQEVAADPLDADAIMVTPRQDLGGRSIADVFTDGDVDLAVRLIHLSGDQS